MTDKGLAPTFRASVRLLGTRRFGTFWVASLLSNIGTWAQQVAEPWLLLTLGGSPFLVGLDAFVMDAPAWLLVLFGGVLADRADRRRVILGFQSVQMLCPLLVVGLLLLGAIQPWMIIALSVVVGVTDALSMPSFQSIVPSLVEPERIGTAIALNSTQFNLSRILGPAFAGVLMGGVGAVGCFAVNAASYLPFILVALWILPRGARVQATGGSRKKLFAELGEIARTPQSRGALLTVLGTGVLCGPLITFCPVLVRDVLHGDANHFAGALAAFGVGGLLGATTLLAIEGRFDRRSFCSSMAVTLGVLVALAALNSSYLLLMVLLVLTGAVMNISNTTANTLLQIAAGPHRRGQTASLFMLVMRGGLSLGSLFSSVTVSLLGVAQALLCNGVLAVLVQLVLWQTWARRPPPPSA